MDVGRISNFEIRLSTSFLVETPRYTTSPLASRDKAITNQQVMETILSFIEVTFENGNRQKLDFPNRHCLKNPDGSYFKLETAKKGGGNGIVFQAIAYSTSGEDEGICAVKLLKELSDKRQDRFQNEIRILRTLNHTNITKYFGHGTESLGSQSISVPWVAMELGGDNLRQYLDTHKLPLDTATAINLTKQICSALEHIHEKDIIHRDLKPANIVWRDDEDRENAFLIDFGIAKFVGEDVSGRKMDQFTQQNEFVGPANFSSPELLAYARDKTYPVDQRSDLFQLGLILWFFSTNQILAGIPSKKRDPSGGKIWELVNGLVAEDPDERIQTATEVSERLNALSRLYE